MSMVEWRFELVRKSEFLVDGRNESGRLFWERGRSRVLFAALTVGLAAHTSFGWTVNWPQFRGPNASGVSEDPAPIIWNVDSGENVRWQTSIPGLGHACPIIWKD